jgi:Amt family ammonium transporter
MLKPSFTSITFLSTLLPIPTFAADQAQSITEVIANLNAVWVMFAAALVFLMQAGFALLEGGMARSKNAVNVIMKNYMDTCVGGLIFWLFGFGLMFGTNITGWIGSDWFMPHSASNWDWSFILFQMMFAATACTIASGAMAERVRYSAYLIGACVITGFIYPVFGAWAWGSHVDGSGWLKEMGFIDFAGSTVVHSVGGWCALAGIMVLGPRLGRFSKSGESRPIPGHNLGLVALGGFILWFGWFGFNGGSTLTGDASIGKIILNTHLSACAGAAGAALFSWLIGKPLLLTSTVNGSIGGLVGITAGCASMDPQFAIITGLISGVVTIIGPMLLTAARLDDVVDAISVHGFCGVWGTMAAGLFFAGDMFNETRILVQAIGIGVCFVWAFGSALLMYLIIDKVLGMRASPLHEQRGLDFTEHAEIGYPEFQQTRIFNADALESRH